MGSLQGEVFIRSTIRLPPNGYKSVVKKIPWICKRPQIANNPLEIPNNILTDFNLFI